MVARSPAEAVDSVVGALQQAVSSVTTAVLVGRASQPLLAPHLLRFGAEARTRTRLGRSGPFYLTVKLHYRVVNSSVRPRLWQVRTVGYSYRLLSRDEQEIVAYHWHPAGTSPITSPHLHIGGQTSPLDLSKAHLPTGHVTLIDVLRLAITDLGVEPLRSDWREVLDQAEHDLSDSG